MDFVCSFQAMFMYISFILIEIIYKMGTLVIDANCKLAEIPVIGGFVIDGALEDVAKIHEVAKDVDEAFLQGVKAKQVLVESLVQPVTLTAELKTVTKRVKETMDGLRPKLNVLEVQLIRAGGELNISVADFGLKAIRKCISKKDAEGTLAALAATLTQVDKNNAALEAKGMTPAQRALFSTAEESLRTDNAMQEQIIRSRGLLTAENVATINNYWADVTAVMKIGRLIFKDDPARLKEYTFTALRRRVNAEHRPAEDGTSTGEETKGAISGTATNKVSGKPEAEVNMMLLNTDKSDMTDEDGECYLDGVTAGKYSVKFVKTGFIEVLFEDVAVTAGEETELDAEMEAE
jgi:hypothetical protein